MKFDSLIVDEDIIESNDMGMEKLKNSVKNENLYKSLECLNICHLIQFDHENNPISFSEEELAILKFTK